MSNNEYIDAELGALAEKIIKKEKGELTKEEEKALLRKLGSHVVYKEEIEVKVAHLRRQNSRREAA